MTKRKYTQIQEMEDVILAMREMGATRQVIADQLGVSKDQIKNWINRYNRKRAELAASIFPWPEGRPRKDVVPRDIVTERAYEIRRLQIGNELLRDFL